MQECIHIWAFITRDSNTEAIARNWLSRELELLYSGWR
jgi:hypothetical protein